MITLPWNDPQPLVPLAPPYGGLKDPCVIEHGGQWHLFATGCKDGFTYDVVHATAPTPEGPWTPRAPSRLDRPACAPAVVAEGDLLHLYVQESYNTIGSSIRHFVSDDGGDSFHERGIALRSLPGTTEAGLYDAHPGVVDGTRYLVYSGFSRVGEPDLHLARAKAWNGPWERLGAILSHEDVPCHNPRGCPRYEWGLEGGQLTELPDGRTLLLGVCFLPKGRVATRQRALLAVADDPAGPYTVLGPAIEPRSYGRAGENGHGCAVVHDDRLYLYFQHRDGDGLPWTLHVSSLDVAALGNVADVAA
jgi:hypothetical protein